ncbi:hypothetical protein CONPUDRAFT_125115 [Coniophora puteana RWD-64-598 SS2]|uniref:MI domain-containing protein n=1 Tax=Coniophora puteana (strain RWD-64-598) TaxID=741705 RepID=A0A5M3MMV7_CONPW|nr:uncharacterized protein CONPUDRAFT_125115 [Coniophora puteana RWD-64-598 SS2]EIW80366.1 hypothetical protein CONPUDRAFT_125115 [Coniophora puteana RWD-64-598 SS2]
MSKSSTATGKIQTQLSSQSAWSKGPPSANSPRSQSPVSVNVASPVTPSHARRPSALSQSVNVKDGVSVARSNAGSVRAGNNVSFGSIDDRSAAISTSPAAAPSPISTATKNESTIKSFGTVAATPTSASHLNGKSSVATATSSGLSKSTSSSSTRPPFSATSASTSNSSVASSVATSISSTSTASPLKLNKKDITKLFQGGGSPAPSSAEPAPAPSPSTRPAPLPTHSPAHGHAPLPGQQQGGPPSQFSQSYQPFVPGRQQPSGMGSPRSPAFPRPGPNGTGPPNQRPGPPPGPGGAPSSPRMSHVHPHGQPPGMPPQQMQPMQWGAPYGYYPGMEQYQWYPGMPPVMHSPLGPHGTPHPPPSGLPPSSHGAPMAMSPRNQPPPLPGTPTTAPAVPHPANSPHPLPGSPAQAAPIIHTHGGHTNNSSVSLSSPPPTPSQGQGRPLNTNASAFVPGGAPTVGRSAKVAIKSPDGREIDVDKFKKASPNPPTIPIPPASPGLTHSRTQRASVRIESESDKLKRLEEETAKKDKENKEREEQERKEIEAKRKAEEEERKKKEEKERAKKEAEEVERKKREEEERLKKEAEEVAKKKKEEDERAKKQAEETVRRKEEERLRKEEEEKEKARLAAEEAEKERIKKEEEEKERMRREKEEEESRLAKLEEEDKRLEEEEGEDVIPPSPETATKEREEGEIDETSLIDGDIKGKKEALHIDTANSMPPPADIPRRRPGPLDLNFRKDSKDLPNPPMSALATARVIANLNDVEYPEGIKSPKVELNANAPAGKFRYDRDFLLQFMKVCTEKPEHLPPLEVLGLEPADQQFHTMSRGGSGRGSRHGSGALTPSGSRPNSVGLGIGFAKPGSAGPFAGMGNFSTPSSKLTSEERFQQSRSASVGTGPGLQFGARAQMTRTNSQGGPGHPSNRTRSKRGEKRGDQNRPPNAQQGGSAFGTSHGGAFANMEPVAPLEASANRWVAASAGPGSRKAPVVDTDSPEVVDRKVKGLLNKLTMEKFDSISDQIIAWANKSEKEKDGRTLIQVIRLVFEKATDEAAWSSMYARLCRKMMEQISQDVQDDGIKNSEGKPIAGGQLFRKYLLNRCQEDFERGWAARETTAAAARSKATTDEAIKAANEKKGTTDESELYSEEYYAAQKAKRQGLGLIKFIGELFKLQMLTERIMHECVKKLLGNVENPEEEEIESLCQLLTTVGQILDTPKAKAHMDVYFQRMKELAAKNGQVSSRMQFMIQDVIELRDRKWINRKAVAAPTTLAAVHEAAAKEKAVAEKEAMQRTISMSRGGSRRGNDRNPEQPDGWSVAGSGGPPRPPPKVGDLSQFGKISKQQPIQTFGPSSVFNKKDAAKRESISRTSSSSNMFQMLSQNPEAAEAAAKASSRPPSRKPSVDFGTNGAPEVPAQRRKLQLLPRTKPAEEGTPAVSEDEPDTLAKDGSGSMTEAEAEKKIDQDVQELFAVRNLEEADVYFTNLPKEHQFRLVKRLVDKSLESKEADVKLVVDFFSQAASKGQCDAATFEEGFLPAAELLDDTAMDAPKAVDYMAMLVRGAQLDKDEEKLKRITEKSEFNSEKLLRLVAA